MAKKYKHYLYRITDVWGEMEGRLEVGVIIHETKFKGNPGSWDVFNLNTGDYTGGFAGDLLGRYLNKEDTLSALKDFNEASYAQGI